MGEIVYIGAGKFERIWQERCPHKHLTYDPAERTVQCKDCNRFVDGFEAFLIAVRYWKNASDGLQRRREEIAELEKRTEFHLLKATKQVDHAWRSKKMVPCCPHCHKAILPEDDFGSWMINKHNELERRKFGKRNG